jgi:hypothetical protein
MTMERAFKLLRHIDQQRKLIEQHLKAGDLALAAAETADLTGFAEDLEKEIDALVEGL